MNRSLKFRIYSFLDKAFHHFTLEEGYPQGIAGDVNEPQQYTGLNDKNGNPIYEGDVVARHHVDLVHKVEYLSNDYYKVEYCEKEAAYICRDCDGGFVYLSDFEYIVIGNRSEKPPCKFDHNFECMVCDGWPSDCPFVKFDKLK